MEEEYKEFKIKYHETGDRFGAYFMANKATTDADGLTEGIQFKGKTLKEIKAKIDKYEKGFIRKKAYYNTKVVNVTSIVETRIGTDFWITWKGKYGNERTKINGHSLYEYSDKNHALIKNLEELNEQRRVLVNKIREYEKQLTPFKPEYK